MSRSLSGTPDRRRTGFRRTRSPNRKRCPGHAIGERDRDHIGFLRDLLLEPRIGPSPPLFEGPHILAGGSIELEARGEILVTRKLRVDSDSPNRLAGALDAAGDGDGRQRHLRDHRGRPDAAKPERAAASSQIHQVRLQARSRDSQRRQERQHRGSCDREAAGVEHRRDFKTGRHPERYASLALGHRGDSPAQCAIGGDQTNHGRNGREHQGLDEQLTDDAHAARTER